MSAHERPLPKPVNHRCKHCGFDRPTQGHRDGCPDGTRAAGNDAYRNGRCATCHERRYRPGGTQCEECYRAARGLTTTKETTS
jgi:hypothetical protein